jgi:hypothetical protein
MNLIRAVAACLVLGGCAMDSVAPVGDAPVLGVVVSVSVPGTCLVGGCDPPNEEQHTLGLTRIVNTSTATAYLESCDSRPALVEQQRTSGGWVNVNQAAACAGPSGRIPLVPGDSLRFNQFFASGTRRIGVTVSSGAATADLAFDPSAPFTVP